MEIKGIKSIKYVNHIEEDCAMCGIGLSSGADMIDEVTVDDKKKYLCRLCGDSLRSLLDSED